MNRRPVLLALDFRIGRAVRYVPKITGGFFTEHAKISNKEGEPTKEGFGGDGLALIEAFRCGKMKGQEESPQIEDQPEVA